MRLRRAGVRIGTMDLKIAAIARDDKTARLCDARTGRLKGTLRHPGVVWALAFSPDGRMLAAGTIDPTLRSTGEFEATDESGGQGVPLVPSQ
jgi:WD40 repeat protein